MIIQFKIFNNILSCIKSSSVSYQEINNLNKNFSTRDSRIIRLDFDGDIAQIIIKSDGFIIKLFPIACFYQLTNPPELVILNTDNIEVQDFINYLTKGLYKIKDLNVISFMENLLSYHSEKLDYRINNLTNNIRFYSFDNIKSKDLTKIAKLFHELLLLKNQYQEIQQTLTQINEFPDEKLKLIREEDKIEEFSRIINIYQNQFEEDVKNLSRMAKELEILIQMTEIKFAEVRNKIAILSLNLDSIILIISIISMFGSIFGMNLNSSLEEIQYCLYYMLFVVVLIASFIYYFVKTVLIDSLS